MAADKQNTQIHTQPDEQGQENLTTSQADENEADKHTERVRESQTVTDRKLYRHKTNILTRKQ